MHRNDYMDIPFVRNGKYNEEVTERVGKPAL